MIEQFESGVSQSQFTLRATVLAAAVIAVVALANASSSPLEALTALLIAGGAATAVHPDSHAGVTFMVVYLWAWVVKVDDDVTAWTLVAALSLLALHTAAAAASLTPPRCAVGTAVAARWARRLAVVAAGTMLLWAAGLVLADTDLDGDIALMMSAMVVLVALARLLASRSSLNRR